MKVIAPGKIILSGEHAVVHGYPALAMAVNRFATTTIGPGAEQLVSFDLFSLRYQKTLTLRALKHLKKRLRQDYKDYLRGEQHISNVLKKPFELSQYVATLLLDKFGRKNSSGYHIQTESTIPIGCGMGSSAATILSVYHAVAEYLRLDVDEESYILHGLEAENLQHGHSSGLDLHVCLNGNAIYLEQGEMHKREIDFPMSMYIVNTGQPTCTTGECVNHVAKFFKDSSLGASFAEVTQKLDQAIHMQDMPAIKECMWENQELLTQIEVVPKKVQDFFSVVKQHNIAAKVCGAGAIDGDKAGIMLLVTAEDPNPICQRFGYQAESIQGELQGVRTISS